MTTTSTALSPDRVYLANDRFVCGTSGCAGMTALYSGFTIGGAPVTPITDADRVEWALCDLGPLTCECGRVTA